MKKRIISIIAISIVVVLVFAICVFALDPTSPPVRESYYSNSKTPCANTDDCYVNEAYDEGFNEGYDFGYDYAKWELMNSGAYISKEDHDTTVQTAVSNALADFKNTEDYMNSVNEELNAYLNSSEFADSLEQGKKDAVNDYIANEGADALNSEYEKGLENGIQAGYKQGLQAGSGPAYAEGYSAGKNEFRTSTEYENELKESMQAGYDLGVQDGYNSGVESSNSSNPTQAIFLMILSVILAILSMVLIIVVNKLRKKVKRK